MKKIYSKVDKEKLICSILKFKEINKKRTDICPDKEFLQVSGRILKKGFSINVHKHNILERNTTLTQEAWVVLNGRIKSKFYDLDEKFIHLEILEKGDGLFFLEALMN